MVFESRCRNLWKIIIINEIINGIKMEFFFVYVRFWVILNFLEVKISSTSKRLWNQFIKKKNIDIWIDDALNWILETDELKKGKNISERNTRSYEES